MRRKLVSSCVLIAVAALIASSQSTLAQLATAPSSQILGCTDYLQLAEAQYQAINDDETRLTKLKAERDSVLVPRLADASNASSNRPAELAKIYETQISNLEASATAKRKVLVAIEKVYRECIAKPPGSKAQAEPAQKPPKGRK